MAARKSHCCQHKRSLPFRCEPSKTSIERSSALLFDRPKAYEQNGHGYHKWSESHSRPDKGRIGRAPIQERSKHRSNSITYREGDQSLALNNDFQIRCVPLMLVMQVRHQKELQEHLCNPSRWDTRTGLETATTVRKRRVVVMHTRQVGPYGGRELEIEGRIGGVVTVCEKE